MTAAPGSVRTPSYSVDARCRRHPSRCVHRVDDAPAESIGRGIEDARLGRRPRRATAPSVAAMTELVRLDAASKQYEAAGPPALDQVSLTVSAGEAVAVMGP